MARNGKIKVPKKIGGVKVPKKVRKTANTALKFADHPIAMELAAAALTAAAASLRARKSGAKAAAATAEEGFDELRDQAGKLKDLVIAAALDGARRLMDPPPSSPDAPKVEAAKAASAPKRSSKPASGGRARAPAAPDA
jgi:hypothetical protein